MQGIVAITDQQLLVDDLWRRLQTVVIHFDLRDERTVLALQEVQITLQITHHDIITQCRRRTQLAIFQRLLGPQHEAVAAIERNQMTWEELEGWWTDAGTFESLLHASNLVAETGANKMDCEIQNSKFEIRNA